MKHFDIIVVRVGFAGLAVAIATGIAFNESKTVNEVDVDAVRNILKSNGGVID